MTAFAGLLFYLPLASLVVLFRSFSVAKEPPGAGWRQAGLRGAAVAGVLVLAVTEALSAVHHFRTHGLLAAWSLLTVILVPAAGWAWWRARRRLADLPERPRARPADGVEWALVVIIGLLLALEFAVAVVAAPNNWDSMTYHLARVMHWLQQGGVQFYPTATDRQLYSGPLAEYAIATLQALTGGDQLANTIQWVAQLGAVAGATRIAALIGAGRRAQLLTALAVVTLPAVALEATSTQNDIVAALITMIIVAATLQDLTRFGRPLGWWAVLEIGVPLGLGFITKATALIVAAPFVVAWAVLRLVRTPRRGLAVGAAAAIVAIVIASPHLVRTYRVYQSPVGPAYATNSLVNEHIGPTALATGVVRDFTTNLALPDQGWNAGLTRGVDNLLRGIGSPPADRATTFGSTGTPFKIKWKQHEDYATNFAHTVLILAGLAAVLTTAVTRRREGGRRAGLAYALALIASYLVFAGYLKWQPWITRLMVPLYILGCPAIGLLLGWERRTTRAVVGESVTREPGADGPGNPAHPDDAGDPGDAGGPGRPDQVDRPRRPGRPGRHAAPRRPVAAGFSAIGLLVAGYLAFVGGSWTWADRTRPVAGPRSVFTSSRYEVRMDGQPWLAKPYRKAADAVLRSGVHVVGLARDSNDWEYPLWVLLHAPRPGLHIEDLTATPPTRGLARMRQPAAIICTLPDHRCREWGGPDWYAHHWGSVQVFIRRGTPQVSVANQQVTHEGAPVRRSTGDA